MEVDLADQDNVADQVIEEVEEEENEEEKQQEVVKHHNQPQSELLLVINREPVEYILPPPIPEIKQKSTVN